MTKELFNAIIKNDEKVIGTELKSIISDKLEKALDVRRVGLTADIFNNGKEQEDQTTVVTEGVSADQFVKGGETLTKQAEVDLLLSKIYDDSKLTKALISNKEYKAGEKSPKGKNPHQKNTINYFLFQLGQQVEQFRS